MGVISKIKAFASTVAVSFICLHLAVLFCVLAISTPLWTRGCPDRGLWDVCAMPNCTNTAGGNDDDRIGDDMGARMHGWFLAVQVTQSIGVGLVGLGLLIAYFTLLHDTFDNSAIWAIINATIQGLASISILVALIIYGLLSREWLGDKNNCCDDNTAESPAGCPCCYSGQIEARLGFSYWINLAGCVFVWIAASLTTHLARVLASSRLGYIST